MEVDAEPFVLEPWAGEALAEMGGCEKDQTGQRSRERAAKAPGNAPCPSVPSSPPVSVVAALALAAEEAPSSADPSSLAVSVLALERTREEEADLREEYASADQG